ncbi:DUF4426 domain-containing protein [Massilia sp. PAMC28688]|uniref:DUF4426 domain-containing protein n=1 Tax=Massilia sp. PAMC28688 TaxID=2861283 RepID=UPI001C638F1A|nr:DUF4426 domain-containing protein [Massilia sp. PAMC28688]QYF92361.1 DUF4426 domain-containing protein [Massilia sp. PAMC28688]
MTFPRSSCLAMALTVLGLGFAAPAWSQMHQQQSGSYTVRSSTVGSDTLSEASARVHGIERSPTRGVLNVTVTKGGQTVPATVAVVARNLTGRTRPIGVKETNANGYVSYTGVYDFVHGEVLDFTVRATPYDSKEVIVLTFRDRMWGRGDLPETATHR